MALWVADPGPQTTVQDLGRRGYQRFGVPVSGAMDWLALHSANLLVGNPPGAPGLEFPFQGPQLLADRDCLVAVCGADSFLRLDGATLPGWTAVRVRAGRTIQAVVGAGATWGYLAVSGGLAVPDVLGSAATYLRGGFGGLEGRTLRAGDWLFSQAEGNCPPEWAGARLPGLAGAYNPAERGSPAAEWGDAQEVTLRVVPGPQEDWFGEAGLAALLDGPFVVQPESDRMGYRLSRAGRDNSVSGGAVPRRAGDLLSEGMVFGAIQVPPNGQPIVMLADRPTTGGYPKIGTVIRADLPRLVQLRPGSGRARFRVVTVAAAQAAYRELIGRLVVERDEDELWMQA